jgi:phage FluMu gp28-like protein
MAKRANKEAAISGSRVERAPTKVAVTPRSLLLPYQLKWVTDESRFKYGLWSRQTGKDFSSGCEIVEDCLKNDKTTWLIGAAGERQALESLAKVKEWAEAYQFAIEDYTEDRAGSEALIKAGTVTWANGSRVIAVPANPSTVRGYSANVLLTEFAFLEDPDATWRAILPSITNPLRGGAKKARIITTPNGQGNKAHELWVKENNWSKHKVTIHDAVAAGLPINIEELREAINDAEGWAQEFECEFLDQASVLLPYELIATCESSEATAMVPAEFWEGGTSGSRVERAPTRLLTMGLDFGRKRDLTVAWTNEHVGDVLHTREVLELKRMSTPDQEKILIPRIEKCQRVCLDYTGSGTGLGDYLVEKFGEWKPDQDLFGKIELCQQTNSFQQDIYPKLKMAFEERRLRIPISRLIREDLHSVSRVTTQNGSISYKAPHTEDGHSDRCSALALAVRASTGAGGFIFAPVVVTRRISERVDDGA